MAMRWCAAGMVEAGKQFRRVNGHLHLASLRTALEREAAEIVGATRAKLLSAKGRSRASPTTAKPSGSRDWARATMARLWSGPTASPRRWRVESRCHR